MKILITLLTTLLIISNAKAQHVVPPVKAAITGHVAKDTTIESDTSKENKEPRYYYISALTNFFVNNRGGFTKRFAPAVEFGRTYGIFDIGLASGQFNSSKPDTAHYLEFRPTINVFSKGRFSEAFCLGGGYVFSARQGLMTEYATASISIFLNGWQ